jgi:phenylalanine-4-hydroxylase
MSLAATEVLALSDFLRNDMIYSDPSRTSENEEVWSRVLRHLETLWRTADGRFFADYLSGLDRLKISASRIPALTEINQMLSEIGWTAIYVDGMVDDHLYHEMQSARYFPVARRLRSLRDIDHSAAPDFIHDVIGHLPMLFTVEYRSLINQWARRAADAPRNAIDEDISRALAALIEEKERDVLDPAGIEDKTILLQELHRKACNRWPSRAARYHRFYAWAIEFGVIADGQDKIQVCGSAALSSCGELRKIFNGETQLISFVDHALDTPVDYTAPQNSMFFVRDFSEYRKVLKEI